MMFALSCNDAALRAMMLPSAMMCPAGHRAKHYIMPQRSEGTSFCKAIHHFAVRRYIMKNLFFCHQLYIRLILSIMFDHPT